MSFFIGLLFSPDVRNLAMNSFRSTNWTAIEEGAVHIGEMAQQVAASATNWTLTVEQQVN